MMRYRSVARSHVGKVRSINEDAVLARDDLCLWCVADGMGGHEAGDVASNAIVQKLAHTSLSMDGRRMLGDVRSRLDAVNADLWQWGERSGRVIGSTVVTLLAVQDQCACIWAGDSRAYLWRDQQLHRITEDHSIVGDLVRAGVIAPEAAESHPDSNVVTRAVGADAQLATDVITHDVEAGDRFLLCSDGLTKMLSEEEIAWHLQTAGLEEAANALISATLERGARDNVSVVLIEAKLPFFDAADDSAEDTIGTGDFTLPDRID